MRRIALPLSVAALLVAGCGGQGSQPADGQGATSSPAPTSSAAEATGSSAAGVAPNVGDRALQVGETRRGSNVDTTLVEVKDPYPPGDYREPEKGKRFIGLRMTQCLKQAYDAGGGLAPQSLYNGDMQAVNAEEEEMTGGTSWLDWPTPKFPELEGMTEGQCMKGWLTIEAPKDFKPVKISYRSPGAPTVAEWKWP